jgi:large subunit ribosomal protein L25
MELIGQKREKLGKSVNSLRNEGLIPAVIFGRGLESTNITISRIDFIKLYKVAGETDLVDLKIDGSNEKVLINEVQYNPVRGEPIHVSFYKPNLKEKVTVSIPVEIVGEEANALVKGGEAMVLVLHDELEIEALPMDLPHSFVVDVSKLEKIGDGIYVKDLSYDREKIELDLEDEELIVKLDKAAMDEEVEEVEVDEAAAIAGVEATSEKPAEEETEEKK